MARDMIHPDLVDAIGGGSGRAHSVAALTNFGDDNKNQIKFKNQEERLLAANGNNVILAYQAASFQK